MFIEVSPLEYQILDKYKKLPETEQDRILKILKLNGYKRLKEHVDLLISLPEKERKSIYEWIDLLKMKAEEK